MALPVWSLRFPRPWRRRQTAATPSVIQGHDARWGGDSFRALVQHAVDMVLVVAVNTAIRFSTPSVEQVLGYNQHELIGTRLVDLLHPEHAGQARAFIDEVVRRPGANLVAEWQTRHRDGSFVYVEWAAKNLLAEPAVRGIVLSGRDVSGRKAREEQLARRAFHDALTDLPNRLLFLDRLTVALARTDRRQDSVAVIFMDLDNFKAINDSLGHETGDRLLIEIGHRLQACVRPSDTVARFGGDEFAVLLEDIAEVRDAVRVAERIAAQLYVPVSLDTLEVVVTASIGVAVSSSSHDRPEQLLDNADRAMYDAKRSGKARFVVYGASVSPRTRERIAQEAEIRRAMGHGEFHVYYQPVIDLASGRVTEVEALLRWSHPLRGLLAPSDFLPLADETGMILPLGRWAMEEACRRVRIWQAQHPTEPPLMLSVNLSARQFQQPNLVAEIAQLLASCQIEPRALTLEVSAGVALWDPTSTAVILSALKDLGVQIALDDVGAGGVGLDQIAALPIDAIKIDRSLTDGLSRDPDGEAALHAIVQAAKQGGLRVTAQGVETAAQLVRLRALGCDQIQVQGYYFARPLPSDAFGSLVAAAPWWTAEEGCTANHA